MDDTYASDIERFIEKGADRGVAGHGSELADFAEPGHSGDQSNDLGREPDPATAETAEAHLAQMLARANADLEESRAAALGQLNHEIKRIQETGFCGCDDGLTHFDERGVLEVYLELGAPYDIDRAWKAWHERTLSWEARSKAREETDPKIDPHSAFEKTNAIEDTATLKKKFLVKREPHRGRIEDHPLIDTILDRALAR
jgi:hypothetical protein